MLNELSLWHRMSELIQEYKNGRLQYSNLVNGLEGIMDASDLSDHKLRKAWYDVWALLEEVYAVSGDRARSEDVIPILNEMEIFLNGRTVNNK